jgi:hypothetical protein
VGLHWVIVQERRLKDIIYVNPCLRLQPSELTWVLGPGIAGSMLTCLREGH